MSPTQTGTGSKAPGERQRVSYFSAKDRDNAARGYGLFVGMKPPSHCDGRRFVPRKEGSRGSGMFVSAPEARATNIMQDFQNPFTTKQFLKSVWALHYAAFKGSEAETGLTDRRRRWSQRADLRERAAQAAFIEEFSRQTWGYEQAGQAGAEAAFSVYPDFPVRDPSSNRRRFADAALGSFVPADRDAIPQVLCEFNDIRSGLEAPQRRKNDTRSPVEQGLGYLSAARSGIFGHEPIMPTWAIITDMNEFRLYWADRGSRQSLRFVIQPRDLFQGPSLLGEGEEARFERFLFARLFHRDTLTVQAASGRSQLLHLIEAQRFRQRELENTFYAEYRGFREHLYQALLAHNGEGTDRFPGTRGGLVRLAQKIINRCIFAFFCEGMWSAPLRSLEHSESPRVA